MKFLLFFLWIFPAFADVPDQRFIESFFNGSAKDLLIEEASVVKKLNFSFSLVKICSSNLKASNVSTNFTNVLDKYAAKIQEMVSMNDFNFVNISIANLSMYDYSQYRISTILSDTRNFQEIQYKLKENSTILYEFEKEVTKQYLNNYFIMVKLRSKNRLVNTVIREIRSIFKVRSSYNRLLGTHIGNYEKLRKHLSIVLKVVPTPGNTTYVDPFIDDIRAVESTLVPAQRQMIILAKVANQKINEALRTVASSRKVQTSANITNIFKKLRKFFTETANMSHYSLLGWPKFPDIPNDAQMIKLRAKMCDDKKRNFIISENIILRKKKEIKSLLDELKAATSTVKSFARQVKALSPAAISAVLTAILNLIESLESYVTKLSLAQREMEDLRQDLFTTTTTTLPTTTTAFVQPPVCGTFVPFNPLTDQSLVVNWALTAGLDSNGKNIYVGMGNNSAYLGLSSCPAIISIDPAKPGAFMFNATGETFDNKNTFFLARHSDLQWVSVMETTAWNHGYGIRLMSGEYPVMIAKVNISGVIYVGRFHYGNGLVGMYYYRPDLNQVVKHDSALPFQIIACTGADPPCDTTSDYATTNVFANAIAAGVHFDGTLAYVGFTQDVSCPMISTVNLNTVSRVSPNNGSFIVCYNTTHSYELQKTSLIKIYTKTKNMIWRNFFLSNVPAVSGFKGYFDQVHNVTVGRYQMSNWTMIGKVITTGPDTGFYGWNPATQGLFKLSNSTQIQILVCL